MKAILVIIALISILESQAFAKVELFYSSSSTPNLSHTVFDFIKTTSVKGPIVIQDVEDKTAMKSARSAFKKCKLKESESGFPLLIVHRSCVTGDYNIIEYFKTKLSLKK